MTLQSQRTPLRKRQERRNVGGRERGVREGDQEKQNERCIKNQQRQGRCEKGRGLHLRMKKVHPEEGVKWQRGMKMQE